MIQKFALCAAVLFAASAHAGNHGRQYTHVERGYYLNGTSASNDGYWYTVKNGCYTRHSPIQAAAKSVTYSANWKSDLVKELGRKKDNELFMQALAESGLQGEPAADGYSSSYATSGTSVYAQGFPLAAQGGTIYGVQAYAPNIGQVDVQGLLSQQARIVERLGDQTTVANNALSDRIGQVSAAQTDVARIQETGRAFVAAMQAAQPPRVEQHTWERSSQSSQTTGASGQTTGVVGSPRASALDLVAAAAFFDGKCAKCHGQDNPKAGLDLSGFASWGPAELSDWGPVILERVTSRDPEKVMPPAKSGHTPATADELQSLFSVFQ